MNWTETKLADHCDTITKGTTPTSLGFDFTDQGIPFVRVQNLLGGSVVFQNDDLFIDTTTHDALRRSKIFSGDVLLSIAGTIGRCAIVPEGTGELNCNQAVAIIRPKPTIDRRFLMHWVSSRAAIDQISQSKVTATISNLSLSQIGQLKIPLPPLVEQKRIATILDQADELRRKRRQALDRLNQLGQAIFYEMFGDFTTNPLGWNTVKLGDVCEVGSSKRVFVEEFVDEGVPFYRGTEVGKLATGEAIKHDLFISPDHYVELIRQSGKPQVGDLLLPSICHDGRIWRVDDEEPFYFKDGRVLWIKKNETVLDSEYLRNHLRNAFLRNYLTIASGTTFAELKIINLKGLSILLPPLQLQTEFSVRIRKVEATRVEMEKAEKAATVLFNALQHCAYRGELNPQR